MVRSFDVLLPKDFPYALVNFRLYFQNYGTGTVNLYHAAGMELIYEQERICYVLPGDVFFQLLRLQNTGEPHERKYDVLLMKGWYDPVKSRMDIEITNSDLMEALRPAYDIDSRWMEMPRLPEPGEELAVADRRDATVYHHFICREVPARTAARLVPLVRLEYLESATLLEIVNAWLSDENRLDAI